MQGTVEKPPEPGLSLVGSVYSNKYHYPQCRWALRIKRKNEIWFSSPEEAKRKGYVPCRECRPPDP
ncbi:MAG: Ada metal-binding domain-containing protein [Bacillota bacterium]